MSWSERFHLAPDAAKQVQGGGSQNSMYAVHFFEQSHISAVALQVNADNFIPPCIDVWLGPGS